MFTIKKTRSNGDDIENMFWDKSGEWVKKGYQILLHDVGKKSIIDPKTRYYILKELQRHKINLNNGFGTFIPDISALLEPYS